MELKLVRISNHGRCQLSSNRTFMELKYEKRQEAEGVT